MPTSTLSRLSFGIPPLENNNYLYSRSCIFGPRDIRLQRCIWVVTSCLHDMIRKVGNVHFIWLGALDLCVLFSECEYDSLLVSCMRRLHRSLYAQYSLIFFRVI